MEFIELLIGYEVVLMVVVGSLAAIGLMTVVCSLWRAIK